MIHQHAVGRTGGFGWFGGVGGRCGLHDGCMQHCNRSVSERFHRLRSPF
jgi:hypothetical protein